MSTQLSAQLAALADFAADWLEDEGFPLERHAVTAGDPPAPSGEGQCRALWVWLQSIENSDRPPDFGTPTPCGVGTVAVVQLRLDHCYTEPDSGEGPSDVQHEAVALEFGDRVHWLWCGLAEYLHGGGLGPCAQTMLVSADVSPRQGGIVSATFTVRIGLQCLPLEESEPE